MAIAFTAVSLERLPPVNADRCTEYSASEVSTRSRSFGEPREALLTRYVRLATPTLGASPSARGSTGTEQIQSGRDTQPEPHGFKSWLIKKALQYMAAAIRAGNYIVREIISHLDKKAARAFSEHADDIADGLDKIAKIPDLSVSIVREKLRYYLINDIKMNHGTAEVIVAAVEIVLDTLL